MRDRSVTVVTLYGILTSALFGVVDVLTTVLGGVPLDTTAAVAIAALACIGVAALGLVRTVPIAANCATVKPPRRHVPSVVLAVDQWALRAQPRSPRAP